MRKSFSTYIYTFVGLASALITIWLYVKEVFTDLSDDAKIASFFLGCFAIYFFLESLYWKVIWGNSTKYLQATKLIFEGLSDIHIISHGVEDSDQIITILKRLCMFLAKAFTLVTGADCAVTIKMVIEDSDGEGLLKAVTLCRDEQHLKSRKEPDESSVKHWVHKNTDFDVVLRNIKSPSKRHFFSNRLPLLYTYNNTSFEVYGDPIMNESSATLNPIKILFRVLRWPLPYKSTIVTPIFHNNDPEKILGFLCIDSPSLLAFNASNDIELLAGVADAIVNPILLLYQLVRKN